MRAFEHLRRRAFLDDAPLVDDGHAVADALGHRQLMRDDHQRDAKRAVDVLEQLQDAHGRGRVQRARSLVAQHDLGVVRQRAGDGDALLLAAGKLAGIAVGKVPQAHQLQELAGARLALGAFLTAQLQREGDVRQHGALLEQAEVLEDHADLAAQVEQAAALVAGHVLPVEEDGALGGALEQV